MVEQALMHWPWSSPASYLYLDPNFSELIPPLCISIAAALNIT